ncbi:MAG: hypothetical protein ACP5JU_02045 [Minisyncoccia bacterium]
MKRYTIILLALGALILSLSFINITKSAGAASPFQNFQRDWIIKTADFLRKGKIDLESASNFLRNLLDARTYANIPEVVDQDKEITITFDPTQVPKWEEIETSESSNLPDKKLISVTLWHYEKEVLEPFPRKCIQGKAGDIPLNFYTDKNLWNSGKIIIKNFYEDKTGCIISTSTINQLNYIVIKSRVPVTYESWITDAISAPFKIKPTPKPYIKIITPEPGSTLYAGKGHLISWESNLPTDYECNISLRLVKGKVEQYLIKKSKDRNGNYYWFVPQLFFYSEESAIPIIPLEDLLKSKTLGIYADCWKPKAGKTLLASSTVDISIVSSPWTTPNIKIITPNGGEKLEIGKTYKIQWESGNLPRPWMGYRLGLWLYGTSSDYEWCRAKIADLPTNYTSYDWKVNLNNLECEPKALGERGYTFKKISSLLKDLVNKRLLSAEVLEKFAPISTSTPPIESFQLHIIAYKKAADGYYVYVGDRSDSNFSIVQPVPRPNTQILRIQKALTPILYGNTTTKIAEFQFVNSGYPEDKDIPFELTFVQYNYLWSYDQKNPIKSKMIKNVDIIVDGYTKASQLGDWQMNIPITLSAGKINGTHTIEFIATTRDYQDVDYPYNYYNLILGFNTVKPVGIEYEKSGSDATTYKIHLPYYPRTHSWATVGVEGYPAIVFYPSTTTKEVSVYFTSFTKNFDGIHVGLQHPNGRRIEIVKSCDGQCPRDLNSLIEKFGHPSEWGYLVAKWDFNKTIQYTGKMNLPTMGCNISLPFDAQNLSPSIAICSKIYGGDTFTWGRVMDLWILWNYTPYGPAREELKYLFILPRDIDQHFPPPVRRAY